MIKAQTVPVFDEAFFILLVPVFFFYSLLFVTLFPAPSYRFLVSFLGRMNKFRLYFFSFTLTRHNFLFSFSFFRFLAGPDPVSFSIPKARS